MVIAEDLRSTQRGEGVVDSNSYAHAGAEASFGAGDFFIAPRQNVQNIGVSLISIFFFKFVHNFFFILIMGFTTNLKYK